MACRTRFSDGARGCAYRLARREHPDVADAIGRLFGDEGIEFLLSAEALQVEGRSGESVRLHVRTPQGERLIEASDILVATGRTPNTAGIGLDTLGVRLDGRGYVQVNDRLETSAPDVWAIGECAGSPQFTHVSVDNFRVIRDNLARGSRTTRDRLVPFCGPCGLGAIGQRGEVSCSAGPAELNVEHPQLDGKCGRVMEG